MEQALQNHLTLIAVIMGVFSAYVILLTLHTLMVKVIDSKTKLIEMVAIFMQLFFLYQFSYLFNGLEEMVYTTLSLMVFWYILDGLVAPPWVKRIPKLLALGTIVVMHIIIYVFILL